MLRGHLTKTIEARLQKFAACRAFSSAKDPVAALHDLRVASRRLRAFGDVFEPLIGAAARRRAEQPLRCVTRAVRALRDSDVQEELLAARIPQAGSDAERCAVELLLERSLMARAKESRRASKRLAEVDFGELRDSVCAARGRAVARLPRSAKGERAISWQLLEPLVVRLEESHPPDDGIERPADLHALRLEAKRLRYAVELLAPALGAGCPVIVERIKNLQEQIGVHHDVFVLEALVVESLTELQGRKRETLATGLAALKSALHDERRAAFLAFDATRYEPHEWRRSIRDALIG